MKPDTGDHQSELALAAAVGGDTQAARAGANVVDFAKAAHRIRLWKSLRAALALKYALGRPPGGNAA